MTEQMQMRDDGVWLEQPHPTDKRWRVAYRLVRLRGRVLIAEARVLPAEGQAAVPAGTSGITSDLMHRLGVGGVRSRLAYVVSQLSLVDERKLMDRLALVNGTVKPGQRGPVVDLSWLRDDARQAGDAPRRRERVATASLQQKVAGAYARAIGRHSRRPIQDVAASLKLPASTVRGLIARARNRELLTPAPGQGAAGGRLQRIATGGLTGGRKSP